MILQQFRQFADLLAEPALLVDSDGVILEVNRAFRSSDLQRPDEVCGRRLHQPHSGLRARPLTPAGQRRKVECR